MKALVRTTFLFGLLLVALEACRIRITPLPPHADPHTSEVVCQPPPIEKNIVGTWRFESNRSPVGITRTGTVTFTAQNHIIDPDSLFENEVDLGRIVDKSYTTDGTYPSTVEGYTDKIFRVDLLLKNNKNGTIWPLYVASNECNKIVIYQLGSYTQPVERKYGFTLSR